jgi:HEAT repeat protein
MRASLSLCLAILYAPLAFAQDKAIWETKTAREWIEQLADRDKRMRWSAAYCLGQLGAPAVEAAEPLRKVLDQAEGIQQDEYVRATAAWALGRIGASDEATIALLAKTLKTSSLAPIRRAVAEALGTLGEPAKPAVAELVQAMEDKDSVVRVNAAVALWRIEKHAKALPALVETLEKGQSPGPYEAALALGRLGVGAGAAAALVRAFRHDDADVRRAAVQSVGRIGRPALPAIKTALADPKEEVRRCATEALGWMDGATSLEPLKRILKNDPSIFGHDSPAARRAAARALERLGPEAKPAEAAVIEAALVAASNDRDLEVRTAAFKALQRFRTADAAGSQGPR